MYKPLCARKYFVIKKINVGLAILNFGSAQHVLQILYQLDTVPLMMTFLFSSYTMKSMHFQHFNSKMFWIGLQHVCNWILDTWNHFWSMMSISCRMVCCTPNTQWSILHQICAWTREAERRNNWTPITYIISTRTSGQTMNVQEEPSILRSQLEKTKMFSDEVGDLILNFFYNWVYKKLLNIQQLCCTWWSNN